MNSSESDDDYIIPVFTQKEVESILQEEYGLQIIRMDQLVAFDDQNLKIKTVENKNYLFKISNTWLNYGKHKFFYRMQKHKTKNYLQKKKLTTKKK